VDGKSVEGGRWGVRGGPKFGDRNLFSEGTKFEGCSGGAPNLFQKGPKSRRKRARKLGPKSLGPKFGTEIFGDRNSGPKLRA
jgi:hypothetical protein